MRRNALAGSAARRQPWALPAICLVLLVAWALHWQAFGLAELGADGALSVDLAHDPIGSMLAFTARDVHPPLFYLLLHGWFDLGGVQYVTAKFLPIASSALALVALFGLGRRLAGAAVGLTAAMLFLIAPADVSLGSTVRDYMPGLACSILTVLLTDRVLSATKPRRRDRALLAIMTSGALLMWYFHLVFLAVEGAWLARRAGLGRRPAPVLRPLVVGSLVALPWYVFALPGVLRLLTSGATAFDGAASLPSVPAAAGAATAAIIDRGGWVGGIALGGWMVAIAIGVRSWTITPPSPDPAARSRRLGITAGLALGGIAGLVPALRWATPGALARYILVLLPFAVLAQAVALKTPHRPSRMLAGVAIVAVLVAQVTSYVLLVRGGTLAYTDDATFAYLASHARPGDVLLFTDPQRRARYVLSGGSRPTAVIVASAAQYLLSTPREARAAVAALASRYQRIWYVESSVRADASTLVRTPLAAQAALADERGFDSSAPGMHEFLATTLQLYVTAPAGPQEGVGATLGTRIMLQTAAFNRQARPGGDVVVDLHWRTIKAPGADYTVFAHLDSVDGQLVAQHDGPPAAGLEATGVWSPGATVDDRRAIALPPGLRPGQYRLDVGLYRGSLRLKLPDGATSIALGTVQVGEASAVSSLHAVGHPSYLWR